MLQLRVNQLEEMVDEYRKVNDGLMKSLDDIGVDPLSGGKDIQRLKQELSETQSARAALESGQPSPSCSFGIIGLFGFLIPPCLY